MRALVTGVTGQDGWYLSEFLLSKGYEVHGLVRWSSRAQAVPDGVIRHAGDMTDPSSLMRVLDESQPDEVYNLAALSSVPKSKLMPGVSWSATGAGAIALMQAASVDARVFQASTSMIGGSSPYAVAKTRAHEAARNLRQRGRYVSAGIMHNHESPRHSPDFLVRRVTTAVARILDGGGKLNLDNVASCRDWGWAPDYVEAMWLTLQQTEPDEYEIGTGVLHSVADVCRAAFTHVGLDWRQRVVTASDTGDVMRAADTTKARDRLGWTAKVGFEEMIARIMEADLRLP